MRKINFVWPMVLCLSTQIHAADYGKCADRVQKKLKQAGVSGQPKQYDHGPFLKAIARVDKAYADFLKSIMAKQPPKNLKKNTGFDPRDIWTKFHASAEGRAAQAEVDALCGPPCRHLHDFDAQRSMGLVPFKPEPLGNIVDLYGTEPEAVDVYRFTNGDAAGVRVSLPPNMNLNLAWDKNCNLKETAQVEIPTSKSSAYFNYPSAKLCADMGEFGKIFMKTTVEVSKADTVRMEQFGNDYGATIYAVNANTFGIIKSACAASYDLFATGANATKTAPMTTPNADK
jgi:hypothetical protein